MEPGKFGLVMGVANKRSIAWATAKEMYEQGSNLILTYQSERLKKNLDKLVDKLPPRQGQSIHMVECDVTNEDQIKGVFDFCKQHTGGLDFAFHSIGYAPKDALHEPFLQTKWQDYQLAIQISSYSLIPIAREGAELLAQRRGSLLAMTYLGSSRIIPHYNVMGVCKAALEATVRYLAYELGERKIRVNGLSAGPVRTLASAGIPNFSKMYKGFADKNLLGETLEAEQVAQVAAFLLSPQSQGITGDVVMVDYGYSNTVAF